MARRGWLCSVAAAGVLVALSAPGASGAVATAIPVVSFSADNGGAPFAGDTRLLTTITPNGDGLRDFARIHLRLSTAARVRLEIAVVRSMRPIPVFARMFQAHAGVTTLAWRPAATSQPRTYLVLATVDGAGGAVRCGKTSARDPPSVPTPVIRIQGIDAAFTQESYRANRIADLHVDADAPVLSVQFYREGPEGKRNLSDRDLYGLPVGEPIDLDWAGRRSRAQDLRIWIGDWPTGMYYAKLTASDGRTGYAPFIVRPDRIGAARVAVVLPTNAWQAYNHEDEDGDGWGDTWYAGWSRATVRLHRHYIGWGIPPRFRAYDVGFLQWLAYEHKQVDYLSDSDLDRVPSAGALAAAYDLIVFPGHHEYVTGREFALIRGYRNRGGNLMFLSANNFYWHVVRHGDRIARTARFRDLGQPEAGLIGSAYVANDRGQHMKPWRVVDALPWLFHDTGLRRGSLFGLGGIEVDERSRLSPRGTIVIASIPRAVGRHRADMTFYTRRGAKVFAAGAFTLAGEATWKPISPLMSNLWDYMSTP